MYEAFVPPPRGCHFNMKSRKSCPMTNQQFAIARRCEITDFEHVRSQVLRILRSSDIVIGHAIGNNLTRLRITNDNLNFDVIRDIQKHYMKRPHNHDLMVQGVRHPPLEEPGNEYSLKTPAWHLLGEEVQKGDVQV